MQKKSYKNSLLSKNYSMMCVKSQFCMLSYRVDSGQSFVVATLTIIKHTFLQDLIYFIGFSKLKSQNTISLFKQAFADRTTSQFILKTSAENHKNLPTCHFQHLTNFYTILYKDLGKKTQLQMLQKNDSFCSFECGLMSTNSYVKYMVFRMGNFGNGNTFFFQTRLICRDLHCQRNSFQDIGTPGYFSLFFTCLMT